MLFGVASGLLKQHIRPIVSLPQPPCPASSYSILLSPQVFPFSKLKLQGGTIICRRGNGSALFSPCPCACSPVLCLCRSFPGQLWLLHHPRVSCSSGSLQRRLCVSPPHGPSKLICHCALTVCQPQLIWTTLGGCHYCYLHFSELVTLRIFPQDHPGIKDWMQDSNTGLPDFRSTAHNKYIISNVIMYCDAGWASQMTQS